MRLISNRQLTGSYGTVPADTVFDCPDDTGKELIADGKARRPDPPRIVMETKVYEPPEVGPVIPFRDLPVPDAQPAPVAAKSDPVLPAADVPKPGTSHPRGRRGRIGSRKR